MEEKKAIVLTSDGFRNTDGPGDFAPFFLPSAMSLVQQPLCSRRRPSWRSIRSSAQDARAVAGLSLRGRNTWCPGRKSRWIFPPARGVGLCTGVSKRARMITGRAYTAREFIVGKRPRCGVLPEGRRWGTLSGERSCSSGVASETPALCRTNYINTCIRPRPFCPLGPFGKVAQYCHTRCLWT